MGRGSDIHLTNEAILKPHVDVRWGFCHNMCMNKTLLVVLLIIIGLLAFTNSSFENSLNKQGNALGTEVVDETSYFAKDASNTLVALIDNIRIGMANVLIHEKNMFHYDIVKNTPQKSLLSYVLYFLFALLSIFFIYKFLYYGLVLIGLYYLFLFIKNKFW